LVARYQQAPRHQTEWVGLFLAVMLLAALLQAGSPGFELSNDGVWTLAKYFPRETQQRIQEDQKKDRGKDEAQKQEKDQAVPRNVDVPNLYLGLYTETMGSDWEIIAGVYKIESDHGQSNAPGVKSGRNAHGCCAGPGQFNMDSGTWKSWRSSPKDNVYDPRDAVPASARMLKAFHDAPVTRTCPLNYGLSRRWVNALRHYNNACWYVADVAAWVRTYSKQAGAASPKVGAVPAGVTFTTTHGCNPKRDWREGLWTPEVRGFIIKLATKFSFRISCGAHGHSQYVRGTKRPSAHWTGRAFDVDIVNREPVGPRSDTAFARQALGFGAKQVGGPHRLCNERSGRMARCFTNEGHQHHWHIQP
jgi:hypothetical protein